MFNFLVNVREQQTSVRHRTADQFYTNKISRERGLAAQGRFFKDLVRKIFGIAIRARKLAAKCGPTTKICHFATHGTIKKRIFTVGAVMLSSLATLKIFLVSKRPKTCPKTVQKRSPPRGMRHRKTLPTATVPTSFNALLQGYAFGLFGIICPPARRTEWPVFGCGPKKYF